MLYDETQLGYVLYYYRLVRLNMLHARVRLPHPQLPCTDLHRPANVAAASACR